MNFFELFNIPVSLQVDAAVVKAKFYELSRKYHPDFFSQATEAAQEEALEKTSLLNKAFKVFNNKDETLKYVLQLKGLLENEEKYRLAPDFLMEMMALNEALMDAKMDADEEKVASCKLQVASLENELYENIKSIIEHFKDGVSTQEALLQVKDYYFKKKYLSRILASVQ
ncbi:MAG: iron-sulfur cluster co-chaperone HscB C-terminal domain-containing protein [Flavobacterium sp.]|nr:iron-sulfur cluster co-chaperone HscB C-terminal domain-containing protein [Flavobacterium sp.]